MGERSFAKGVCALVKNLLLAAMLYGGLYSIFYVYQNGTEPVKSRLFKDRPAELPSDRIDLPTTQIDLPPSTIRLEKINPNANWFNRPVSLAKIKYDYMGERPNIDTVANLTRLVDACRGSYEKQEKMHNVQDCMKYLDKEEKDYFYIPEDRPSKSLPSAAEYANADGYGNSLSKYPKQEAHSKTSIGQCNGPIVPYHVYWTGPATWRVELFIKSYLYTQNIPCSRLWIWLDSDRNHNAVADMLERDPLFAMFLPFVQRGDISLHAWRFPSRIPLPKGDNTDGLGYWKVPGIPRPDGERDIGDGLVMDIEGQEWLVLTPKQMTFLPVAVSDAVRFVVLHIHGGAYFDMDVMLLRDMRPLLIGKDHSFAERWAAHPEPGDYNTAVMSLTANSSISSYLLRGGVRMGLNFHPRIIGRMAVKDGRNKEFVMLESALFDPIWPEFNWNRDGLCTVPCFHDYSIMFKGGPHTFPKNDEWEAFEGEPVPRLSEVKAREPEQRRRSAVKGEKPTSGIGSVTTFDKEALAKAPYHFEEDNYPPTNRTLENFFRGAWSYHIHNQVCYPSIFFHLIVQVSPHHDIEMILIFGQWIRKPQPSSWFAVVQHAHNVYFAKEQPNPYGEYWTGPPVGEYAIGWDFT